VRGLAPAESSRRLLEHGPNLIRAPRSASARPLRVLLVDDPLPLVLALAAVVAARFGHWAEALVIGCVAALNGALGLLQESRGGRALAALSRLSGTSARVVRGGKSFLIPAGELVPGDLAEVAQGERVPADMRLYAARGLFADESALTGESLPTVKDPALVLPENAALGDRANLLFAGTLVTAGSGTAVVTATGMRTEIGRIARLLAEVAPQQTPLRRRLAELGRTLAVAGLALGGAAAAATWFGGAPAAQAALAAVTLVVAIVPAGLPWIVTAALSAGVRRLGARGVVASSLPAVETLGAITVIGTDKTGILTRNEMTVRELFLEDETLDVTGTGYAPEGAILRGGRPADAGAWETLGLALRIGALCSDARLEQDDTGAWRVAGDPIEGALLSLAAKGGLWREEPGRQATAVFPFSAERRRMTVVVPGRAGRPLALTKGAPDIVLAHCLHQRTPAGVRPLSPGDRERILRHAEEMEGRAMRVLGLACREDALGHESRAIERAMVWVGLVGMLDPPRPDVLAAIAECRSAGISPVIVTGDHKLAALAVARGIGALHPGDEAISGEELDQLTPEALGACVERYRVYARVTAEQRLRIIRAWKRRGHLIAMTGDGINDAPALREADVGIAVGRGGAEVTREAAAMAVADDSFAAIVGAVAEGRGILENIRRVSRHLIAGNVAATAALFAAALARSPLPLSPLQLLWATIAIAALPALALGLAPKDGALMQTGPHGPRERILDGAAAAVVLVQGALSGAVALGVFIGAWRGGAGDLAHAQTRTFAVLAAAQLVQTLGFLRRERPLPSSARSSRLVLPGAVALAAGLLAATVQVPLLGRAFGLVPLARGEWLLVAGLALATVPPLELFRAWQRSREDRR
jgi:P-type Ca2+ transporter type 2C